MSHFTPEIAGDNLDVLAASASQLLPLLLGIFVESTVDEGVSLQYTIGEFASIAHGNVVRTFSKKTMHRLLKVTQEAGIAEASRNNNSMQVDDSSTKSSSSVERARLFDLAVSLLPGLDEPALDVLFSAIKPTLQDVDGLIQKKAYKVLSIILKKLMLVDRMSLICVRLMTSLECGVTIATNYAILEKLVGISMENQQIGSRSISSHNPLPMKQIWVLSAKSSSINS